MGIVNILANCLVPLLLPAGVGTLGVLLRIYLRGREDRYSKTTTAFLTSVLHGVTGLAVVFAVAFISISYGWLSLTDVFEIERFAHLGAYKLKQWTTLGVPIFVCIVVVLIGLNRIRPDLLPVSTFATIKSKVSSVVLALTVGTSFTFFAPYVSTTLTQPQLDYERYKIDLQIEDLKATLREEWRNTGEQLAARYLTEVIPELTTADIEKYCQLFQAVGQLNQNGGNDSSQYSYAWLAKSLATKAFEDAIRSESKLGAEAKPVATTSSIEIAIDGQVQGYRRVSEEGSRLQLYTDLVNDYEVRLPAVRGEARSRNERTASDSNEAIKGLSKAFSEALVSSMPDLQVNELVYAYLKKLVSQFGEYVAEEVATKALNTKEGPVTPVVAEELGRTINNRDVPLVARSLKVVSDQDSQLSNPRLAIRLEIDEEMKRRAEQKRRHQEIVEWQDQEKIRGKVRAKGR